MGYFDEQHPTLLSDPVSERDHVRGPTAADVTLVEYGDFACPSCRAAYRPIKDLLARLPDVRFVFRANPRSHLFPAAEPAAEAAEIAAASGKFWEMHDRLFEADGRLSRASLVELARAIALDPARLERDLDAGTYRAAVRAQEVSGWHSHVLATPTFFINGIRFEDSLDRLEDAVDGAKRRATPLRAVFREGRVRSTDRPRRQLVTVGPHELVSDLPQDEEGDDAGPGPYDLLLAALGACTAMTVQWSAEKHHLRIGRVEVRLSQSRTESGHLFRRSVEVEGDLSEADRGVLQHAAEACPMARSLTRGMAVETRFSIGRPVDEPASERPASP
jgi:uncharacterized OsmC-like protein/predicted DsbA family dithiol-disulfide isomerase